MIRRFLAAALLLGLAGCGSLEASPGPVGVGRDTDEYKRSPCACIERLQAPPDTGFWRRLNELRAA